MKPCRFLHDFSMFPLKIFRGLCRILHTSGMILFVQQIFGSSSSWEVLAKIQVLWIFDTFLPRSKNSDGLAVVRRSGHHPLVWPSSVIRWTRSTWKSHARSVFFVCDLLIFCETRAHDIFVGPGFDSLPLQHDYFVGPGFNSLVQSLVVGQ